MDELDLTDPRQAEFARGQQALAGAQNARTVQDWIALLRSRPNPSDGERRLLAELQARPNDYEVRAGSLRRKTALDFVGNHPWLTVGGFLAGAAAPALLGGGGAAAGAAQGAAGGVLPSASVPGAFGATIPAVASQGISAGIPMGIGGAAGAGLGAAGAAGAGAAGAGAANAAAGGGSLLSKVLTGLKDYGPLALGGAAAIKGLTGGGRTPAEDQLANIIKMAEGRAQASEPLFQALNRMTMAQLPTYVREGQK